MGAREAIPTTLEQLVDIAHNLYISKLLSGVAVTLVVYDWMLVLGDEYDTIYQSRWSLAKGLLLYIRIASPPTLILTAFTLADLRPELSSSFCAVWLYIQTMGFYTSMFAANGLLSLRLMALYRRKKFISWFIAGFFIVTYGLTLGLMIDGLGPVRRDIFYSDVVHTCAVTVSSTIFSAVFYAPAAFELFLFSLTAYSVLKDARLLMAAGVGETCTPFLTVFYRDGILVFLIMAGLRVWNIWIYLTQQVSTYTMGTQLMWAANVVLITRVYMNLCWLAKKPVLTPPENDSAISNEIRTCATVNIFRMRRHDHGQTSYDRGRRGLVSFERWRQDEGLTFHSLESNDRVGMSASVGVSKSPTPRPLNAEKDSAGGVEDAPPVLVASARSPIAIPPPVILAS